MMDRLSERSIILVLQIVDKYFLRINHSYLGNTINWEPQTSNHITETHKMFDLKTEFLVWWNWKRRPQFQLSAPLAVNGKLG